MLSVLLNWFYIFSITYILGFGFLRLLTPSQEYEITRAVICGTVITTVYAQFFSIFYRVGAAANLILLVLCTLIVLKNKSAFSNTLSFLKSTAVSWDGVLYAGILLLIAFSSSRGLFHTDTNIYHAQAIRWYEEMGVVKGLGNLQWHFAYNSAYFAFAALFSLSFLGLQSFHCTTGFLAAVLCIWALRRLQNFTAHEKHLTDMGCIAILLYALVNYDRFMSPASDYAAMFLTLYLIARWAQEAESVSRDLTVLSLLCVLTVFLCTLKLSVGPIALLTICPAIHLVREKRFREIALYLTLGIMTALPFLIRNIIISGWLIYPFPTIDLLSVDWKLPLRNVLTDAAQIKVWARCLYDVSLLDMPMKEWLPVWWNAKDHHEQMLLYCNILALCLDVIIAAKCLIKKEKPNGSLILLYIVMITCAVTWFTLAPFIRYGLAFLLDIPLLAVGMWFGKKEDGPYRLISGSVVLIMFLMGSAYWERYFMDDMVYVKHSIAEPYYLLQKDYDEPELQTINLDSVTVYTPAEGEVSGYHHFPATTYPQMLDGVKLRGGDLKSGFYNQEP